MGRGISLRQVVSLLTGGKNYGTVYYNVVKHIFPGRKGRGETRYYTLEETQRIFAYYRVPFDAAKFVAVVK